jgi:hypothetical protein
MATAEPALIVNSAQQLEPGIAEPPAQGSGGLLSRQSEGLLPSSNLAVEILSADQLPNPRPSRVLFAALRDPRLRMKQPIPLDVTLEEGHVVVNWAAIDEFGSGDNLSAAIDDFAYALRALYRYLSGVEELGPDLANAKRVLSEYIEKR